MGVDYITHSFKVAQQTDPAAKLYYNDFNIERCCNAKINATIAMIRTVKVAGAPVHGIGMQGHSRVGMSPSKREMKETMARFSELVDEVAFTEVDIRHTKLPIGAAEREQQGKDYMEVVGACLETPKCVGITVWDFTDQVCDIVPPLGSLLTRCDASIRGSLNSILGRERRVYGIGIITRSQPITASLDYCRVLRVLVLERPRHPHQRLLLLLLWLDSGR